MSESADTAKGVIDRVVQWKSGKGYFLNFSGDETDYYGFGSGNYRPGTFAEFEVKDGTGQFCDKVMLVKLVKNPVPKQDAKAAAGPAPTKEEKEIDNALNVYCDKNRIILEQSCLKAAARIVSRIYPRSEKIDWEDVAKTACTMKNYFVVSILSQGETDETGEP